MSVYSILRLSLLLLSSLKSQRLKALFVSSEVLGFASTLCMTALSILEHARAPRPSIILNAYLSLTLLFDIAQVRTLWLASASLDETHFTGLFTAGVALKAIIIVLESRRKSKWIRWDVKYHSPEEFSGLFGLGAFLWLNRLFLKGYRQVLTLDDLFSLDQNLASATLNNQFAHKIDANIFRGRKHGLTNSIAKSFAIPLLIPVGPRIAMTGFLFCQPFLINTLLDFLQQSPEEYYSPNVGYGLIGATVLIYSGIALSTAFYWYFQERAMYMIRGVLASAVYRKTTEAKLSAANESAALTLMSGDVERILKGCLNVHEFWANTIEVALACWLLSRQVGAAFVSPLIIVGCCIICSAIISRYVGPRQQAWMEKIQKRVSMTANVLGQMKQLKVSGLAAPVEESIQGMRVDELKTGARFRMMAVWSTIVSFAPLCISPVITFAFASRTLDVTTIFTSMSWLLLLANPLSVLFQMIPSLLAALTCFERIQIFLEADSRVDYREAPAPLSEKDIGGPGGSNENREAMTTKTALKISEGSFGWQSEKFSLNNLDLEVPVSQLTIVVGPVASGKSTLCKALLGETPVSQGRVEIVSLSRKIGYCDQTPYLSNSTIRQNIIGFSPFDQSRYDAVVDATMLRPDLNLLPQTDETKIGSNGITLSGGQKQRVSLARALYLDTNFFVFDDIMSGLDADTEEQVFRRVFSSEGLLRKRNATVVLCTHSVRRLPSADHVIVLGPDGVLVEQGSFRELVKNQKYVSSLNIKETEDAMPSGGSVTPVQVVEPEQSGFLRAITAAPISPTEAEDTSRMIGDTAVYRHYFARVNKTSIVAFFVFGIGW
jgi:ATP-binding cassette, subfamily C (CFTR/MRP), member 1